MTNEPNNRIYQFAFFPYFPTTTGRQIDMKVNRLHLFNFWRFGKEYIKDDALREKLEQIASMYVDSQLRPSQALTVAVIDDNYSLMESTDEQVKDLERYALAWMFCTLTRNQQQAAWASDNFTYYRQNFAIRADWLAYSSGSYVRITNTVNITDKRFVRPDFIPSSTFFTFDEELLTGLANMIDSRKAADDFIFAALPWVRYAFSNADGYSAESRPVMLATAFEILFDIADFGKADDFSTKLEALLEVDAMPIYDNNFNVVQRGL